MHTQFNDPLDNTHRMSSQMQESKGLPDGVRRHSGQRRRPVLLVPSPYSPPFFLAFRCQLEGRHARDNESPSKQEGVCQEGTFFEGENEFKQKDRHRRGSHTTLDHRRFTDAAIAEWQSRATSPTNST